MEFLAVSIIGFVSGGIYMTFLRAVIKWLRRP